MEKKSIDKHRDKLIHAILELGFKDVTVEQPIEMIEMFDDVGFGRIHGYSHRYIKEEVGFKHQILLEFDYMRVEIEGVVINNFGYDKFHIVDMLGFEDLLINKVKEIIDIIKQRVYDKATIRRSVPADTDAENRTRRKVYQC